MEKEDLEITKPIKKLNADLISSRSKKYETLDDDEKSREVKYKDAMKDEMAIEMEEESEEALAEKNIQMAEELLNEENKKKDDGNEENNDSKSTNKKNLITKFKELPKKKKIIIGVVAVIILILIVVLIVMLFGKKKENSDNQAETPTVVETPIVFSNYYYQNGELHFVNEKDEEIGVYTCTNKDEKLCYVPENKYRDNFDVDKLVTIIGTEKSQYLPVINDEYVFVFDNDKEDDEEITMYSIKDSEVIDTYYDVKSYDDNYVIVANAGKEYGLLQLNDEVTEVIKPQYAYLGMISGSDDLIAKTNKGYVVIDKENKTLSKPISATAEIKYYNDKLVVASESGEYALYDYEGNMIVNNYDFITISDEYAALVKGYKAYVIDKDGLKYNEEAIALSNTNYVKTYVYNDDDTLTETKKSFKLDVQDSSIALIVYASEKDDKYTYLDRNVALTNKLYNYVNYFDGKLYFYKDEEKTNLIGTYKCSNVNEVTGSDSLYSTCMPASDSNNDDNFMMSKAEKDRRAIIPIYNERYVFVHDGDDTIYLYDLVESKSKGTYVTINTYTSSNNNLTLASGKATIVVQNKKNLYGVITIDGENVSKTKDFDYSNIEKVGTYFIGLNTSSKWEFLSGSVTTQFEGKIMAYSTDLKYFVMEKDGKYVVVNAKGLQVSSDGYSFIELGSDYFVGVDSSNNLKIYDYNGAAISDTSVKIGDYDFYGVDNPAFKVTYSGSVYKVSVWDGSVYNVETISKGVTPVTPGDPSEEEKEDNKSDKKEETAS